MKNKFKIVIHNNILATKCISWFKLVSIFCCIFFLPACVKSLPPKAPLPDVSIGLIEFNQVFELRELIAGYIPENTSPAPKEVLERLDLLFKHVIGQNVVRSLTPLNAQKKDGSKLSGHKSGRYSALLYWAELGQENGQDVLLLPQVLYWKMNEENIHLKLDFYLISTAEKGALIDRSSFEISVNKTENIESQIQVEIEQAMRLALREFRI